MEKWDEIGEYAYIPGYCARDAMMQYFGNHPLIREWFPLDCSIEQMRAFCECFGYTHQFGGPFNRTFEAGRPVVWIYTDSSGNPDGHVTFLRNHQRIADLEASGDIIVYGYILLDE